MALEEYRDDLEMCDRCSKCKIVPLERIKSLRFSTSCPSISKHKFHVYSGGGKGNIALALMDNVIEFDDKTLDIIYKCAMCGACDVSCKYTKEINIFEVLQDLRLYCVENGYLVPELMAVIDGLRNEDNMMQALKSDRGKWAEGLDLKDITKEKADVIFHAGCRYSFDETLWPSIRSAIAVLKKAGIDVGIAGKDEVCCGGRSFEMGYRGELTKYAENNIELFKQVGAKTLVTSCADCYYAFKVLYDRVGMKLPMEVLHITEYVNRLIKDGTLKPIKEVPMTVTYHDPCHLGRKGEPWIHWEGEILRDPTAPIRHMPPKELRRGTYGIYEAPRDILKSIPGVKLVEMERIKEYSWCCGSGGGLRDTNPDFALWTASERIEEAKTTNADALVSACPWCQSNFTDAINQNNSSLKVFDIIELLDKAV